MRILHATQYFTPWAGYQEYYLAREQLRVGHDVLVVSSNLRWPGAHYATAMADRTESRVMSSGFNVEEGVPACRLPVVKDFAGRLFLSGLAEAIRLFAPDVVHAHLL